MNKQSILLGAAMAVALAGASFAQTSGNTTPTNKPVHHAVVHHYRHHIVHRAMHTASLQSRAKTAEQSTTNNLNREQLRPVQYGPQYAPVVASANPQRPGQSTGITPVRRIPNGLSFQSATPAGGRADTPSLNSAQRL